MGLQNEDFMSESNVKERMEMIKIKICEGYDRIPQRVLVDGIPHQLKPLTKLFNLIYNQKTVPDQSLISKLVPIHKNTEKCRPED